MQAATPAPPTRFSSREQTSASGRAGYIGYRGGGVRGRGGERGRGGQRVGKRGVHGRLVAWLDAG